MRLASLVRKIAGGHHEGEEERLVAGVGGVVAGRDHRLQVCADAQVVREVGGWNNPSANGLLERLARGCVKPEAEITQTSGAVLDVRTEYDVPEEVEAAHVFSLGKRLQDVAALRVQDAHGLQLRED